MVMREGAQQASSQLLRLLLLQEQQQQGYSLLHVRAAHGTMRAHRPL
jgi:hypothetical protein